MVIRLIKSHKLDPGSLQEDSFQAIFPDDVYVDGAKIVQKDSLSFGLASTMMPLVFFSLSPRIGFC